jgi:uncharacterized membrane protein
MLANSDLAHVLLFGPFLLLALLGMPVVESRRRRAMGPAEWQRLTAATSRVPFLALLRGAWRPRRPPSVLRLVVALVAWAGLWHLHTPVIGVWPGV